jgi:hypothetical protein
MIAVSRLVMSFSGPPEYGQGAAANRKSSWNGALPVVVSKIRTIAQAAEFGAPTLLVWWF